MATSTRICNNCGAMVPQGHHYCGRCGASYHADGGGSDARNETMFFGAMQAPGRAKLILIKGEGLEGLSYHLNATEHVAGRNNGAILFTEDNYLSPKHATFLYRENELHVRDEGSRNGTFLKLRGEPRRLADGDEFLVGEQLLRVEVLDLQREYPMREDTLMYVSPPKDYKFRVVHVIRGGKPGASYCSINNDILIGREGCDINLSHDRHVSRKHTRVTWADGAVELQDMGSKNGTFVRLKDTEKLQHGDYVYLGSELMRVEING